MKTVVIVGAGVIGLMCAVRLAKAGARVTVLEAEAEHPDVFGPGASMAAAGMLSPLSDKESPHDALAFASLDLWRAWQPGAEWADGVRFDGAVLVGSDAAAVAALARRAEQHGRKITPLSAGQVRKRTGFRAKLEHAVFTEDEGTADPQRVLSGLAMQARAHGVIIENRADVANVTARAAKTHNDQLYAADIVVLAPGAWATDKLIAAAPALGRIGAAKGHLVAVQLDHALGPNLHTPRFYIAQRREDVVLGATLEPDLYDRRVDPARVEELTGAAEAILPGEVASTGHAWAGVRPMSPDGWPLIGPTGDGLFVAAGHSRNGWLLAPITAEIISAYVFGAEIPPEWAALSPERFESQ